jgi:hypothetical protein
MARDQIGKFRALVFSGIKRALEADGYCKSYEGRIVVAFPDYFHEHGEPDDRDPNAYSVDLHCYVLGPHRHYNWTGRTLGEALRKATRDVRRWIKELE